MTSAPQELTEELELWVADVRGGRPLEAILQDVIVALRSPGIEEAAKVCDSYAKVTGAYTSQMFENAAEEIRALAAEAQPGKEGGAK